MSKSSRSGKGTRENKWSSFEGKGSYQIVNMGRPAVFLIPTKKLKRKVNGVSIEDDLHQFLVERFDAYTTSLISNFGFWRNGKEELVYDECREYEVSFSGKELIPVVIQKLVDIARLIEEDCIYFKAGQYTCLVRPSE